MLRVTAVYPNRPGSRFDAADYAGRHAAVADALLRPHGLVSIAVTIGAAALDGGAPPFWAIGDMRFASRAAFDAAMAACGAELLADAAIATDVEPILQISQAAPASPTRGEP